VGALRSIGVNVDYQINDFGTTTARRNSKNPVTQGGWHLYHSSLAGLILASPATNLVVDSSCDGKNYYGWPCDAEVERLRAAWLEAPDETARQAITQELSRALWTSLPAIPVGQYIQPYAWRRTVTGLLKTFPLVFWGVDKAG
jgi:peptide/nickel transport system substrate-binding protein